MLASIKLAEHQPRRHVVAELRSEPLRRTEYRRQRLDFHDLTDGARRDDLGPERFNKADLGSDRVHERHDVGEGQKGAAWRLLMPWPDPDLLRLDSNLANGIHNLIANHP